MFDLDRWREIFQSIGKNKLRSVLSGFTVGFAILLFTLLFGIGNGLKNTFKKEFSEGAINSIYIWAGKTTKPYKGKKSGRKVRLKNEDFQFLKKEFSDKIQTISPISEIDAQVVYKDRGNSYVLKGVYPGYQLLKSVKIVEGRFLNLRDIQQKSKVIAIGRMVEKDLFRNLDAYGKELKIKGIIYKVIGVFSDSAGDDEERIIYTPFTTIQQTYQKNDYIDQLGITYNPKMSVDQAITFGNRVRKVLKNKHDVSPRDQRGIRIDNNASDNKKISKMMFVLGILILIIGLGTLIAGVVGISNIMVYTVNERTKELGIRKAVGATPRAIIAMIMQEAVFITALSGYIGLIIGVGILKLTGSSLKKFFILNPGVSTSVVVGATIILIIAGIIAGYLPAKRAANIKPIVALRAD